MMLHLLLKVLRQSELSNDDMQSMFIDYYRNEDDEYLDQMKMAVHAVQYEIACEGFPNPVDDGTRQVQTVPGDSVPPDSTDAYLSQVFRDVRKCSLD